MTNYIWLEALSNYIMKWIASTTVYYYYYGSISILSYFYNCHFTPQIDYHWFAILCCCKYWFLLCKENKILCLVIFNYWWGDLREFHSTQVCYGHIVHVIKYICVNKNRPFHSFWENKLTKSHTNFIILFVRARFNFQHSTWDCSLWFATFLFMKYASWMSCGLFMFFFLLF